MAERTASATVVLKSGRDKSVRNRHPRLFAGGIKYIEGHPKDGDVVEVVTNNGEWLARGIINQQAHIAVRLLTWHADERIDDSFWRCRVQAAVQRRMQDPALQITHTNARRLIFGESDGLPGVVADDYAGHIVMQVGTLAAARAKATIVQALVQATNPISLTERSDEERLKHEHVKDSAGPLYGNTPTQPVEIFENGLRFWVDLHSGQKTGFYLDQRANRASVARYCSGASVLNAFSFSGGFGVYAAQAGATQVLNVDSSAEALKLADANAVLNQVAAAGWSTHCADAFDDLRARRKRGEQFDVVVVDPPKFAHSVSQIDKAARAYKDLNRIGLALVKPGGILATFSCSGVISPELFQKIIFSAAIEAQRDAQIVEKLAQASDHPILLSFPESDYLKGLVCRVSG